MHSVLTDIMAYVAGGARMIIALRTRHGAASYFQQLPVRFYHAAAGADTRKVRRLAATICFNMRKK
jgi:hypothetical protein